MAQRTVWGRLDNCPIQFYGHSAELQDSPSTCSFTPLNPAPEEASRIEHRASAEHGSTMGSDGRSVRASVLEGSRERFGLA